VVKNQARVTGRPFPAVNLAYHLIRVLFGLIYCSRKLKEITQIDPRFWLCALAEARCW